MTVAASEFIRQQTAVTAASLVPEIKLYLAAEVTPLWQMAEEQFKQTGMPPPYWAFAWPGGQGLARHILDNPALVKGRRVLDFAAGCGIAAIAAMKMGAKHAMAIDIDPVAEAAAQMNAEMNGVNVDVRSTIDMNKAYAGADLILAGDVCYQQMMSTTIVRWLRMCAEKGTRVLLAEPGRAYVPHEGLKEIARYEVPTSRDLEDSDSRIVTLWEMV
jgi:predicted nicotinamide N-methyase